MIIRWRRMWQDFLDLLYPERPKCALCGRFLGAGESWLVCSSCLHSCSHPLGPLCLRCGRPSRNGKGGESGVRGGCLYCANHQWAFSQARSFGPYDGELRMAIHRLKFRGQARSARALAELMVRAVESEWWPEIDMIVPVPLHEDRLRQRGFNQAVVLGYELALLVNRPVHNVLIRSLPTRPQTGLSRLERQRNLHNAFKLSSGAAHQVKGKRVLIIDDVMTTGSTLDACARVLRKAGAKDVRVLTIAVTNLRQDKSSTAI